MIIPIVNGIDVEELQDTMSDLREEPELAHFNFRVNNRWIDGMHTQAEVMGFFEAGELDNSRITPLVYDEDEPPVLLGGNMGANPVEYVLVGLAGCMTTTLVAHAAAQGVRLKTVESRLEGDIDVRGFLGMDNSIRNGYENIRVTFQIESDEPEEVIQELIAIAQSRSPVYDIVTNKVPVTVGYERKES